MRIFVLTVALGLSVHCVSESPASQGDRIMTIAQVETLRAALSPYPQSRQTPELSTYRTFFGLDESDCDYQSGTLADSKGQKIFVQTFAKQSSGGIWVLLVHGYLDHAGLNPRPIRFFLNKGWNVAVLDLPGHGLSDGKRGFIEDFDRYGDAVQNVFQTVNDRYQPRSWVPCGFSAGGASLMNWILRYKPASLSALVLVSPLVRSYLWDVSQVGMTLLSWALQTVPNRPSADSTTNPELADLMQNRDPLRIGSTDLGWMKALTRWVERLKQEPGPLWVGPTLVYQGGQDTVVDSAFNLQIVQKLFPNPRVEKFPTLRHLILNEPGAEGDRVYQVLTDFLFSNSSLPGTL